MVHNDVGFEPKEVDHSCERVPFRPSREEPTWGRNWRVVGFIESHLRDFERSANEGEQDRVGIGRSWRSRPPRICRGVVCGVGRRQVRERLDDGQSLAHPDELPLEPGHRNLRCVVGPCHQLNSALRPGPNAQVECSLEVRSVVRPVWRDDVYVTTLCKSHYAS